MYGKSMYAKSMYAKITAICLTLAAATPAAAVEQAKMKGGSYTIAVGERASFPVATRSDNSTDFSGWCELTAGGSASIVFDGRHYVPLSEPAVGDVITFNGPGKRRFEMTGTFEANAGNADISFYFASIPVAFCFGGGDCASVAEGSNSIMAQCGQN